jgi:hypothetical protein
MSLPEVGHYCGTCAYFNQARYNKTKEPCDKRKRICKAPDGYCVDWALDESLRIKESQLPPKGSNLSDCGSDFKEEK